MSFLTAFPFALILGWWVFDLQVHWQSRPEYQFGWVVLLLVGFLAWDRWPSRPASDSPRVWLGILLALAAMPCVLLAELYKQGVGTTPTSSMLLSIGCTLFVAALVLAQHGASTLRHFIFPLLFLFVAVPIPKIVWNPVVLGLQGLITTLNVETLKLMGIPAQQLGNVIRLPNCTVGVDEACSGVRSLQSCVMAALFIGDQTLRFAGSRIVLFVVGIGLALIGNFARSLYLSTTAHRAGPEALHNVHDAAGWSILLFTAVGLALFAWFLSRVEKAAQTEETADGR